jgi:sulfite reductase (NADPH) flavoprotein alpha-component
VYASESGNSEKLAGDLAKAARKHGLRPSVVDMADLDLGQLRSAKRLAFVAATWGEGDPPSRAVRAYNELMGEAAPRLDGVEYGVLALGDTAYAEFCAVGKKIDERLAALEAKRVVERADLDLDFAQPAAKWIGDAVKALQPSDTGTSTVIEVDFGKSAAAPSLEVVEAEITEHVNLNSSQSAKETIHVELAFDGAAPAYQPGDSLDLYPENDATYVDDLLQAAGLAGDDKLRSELIKTRDVTTLSLKVIETYAAQTGHQYVKAMLVQGQAKEWIASRQLIDLIATFPIALTAEQLRALQWLALDQIAPDYGNGRMQLTTRQTVQLQLHGVIKSNLRSTIKAIDAVLLNSIAACGDINRNVMCNPNPYQSRAHAAAIDLARAVSDHLLPRTPAYREIWIEG